MMQPITVEMALALKTPKYALEVLEGPDGLIALRVGHSWLSVTPPQFVILVELAPLQITPQPGLFGEWTLRHRSGRGVTLPLDALMRPGKAREDLLFILIGRAVRRFPGACALADFHSRLADLFHMADAALA